MSPTARRWSAMPSAKRCARTRPNGRGALGLPFAPQFPDVRSAPRAERDGWPLFRVGGGAGAALCRVRRRADAHRAQRAPARTRHAGAAQPGDLLYFHQPAQTQPDHLMVFVGRSIFEPRATTGSCITPVRSATGPAKSARCGSRRSAAPSVAALAAGAVEPALRRRVSVGGVMTRAARLRPSAPADACAASASCCRPPRRTAHVEADDAAGLLALEQPGLHDPRGAVVLPDVPRMPQLDFRVYKVRDPFAFFAGLRDPHQLGSDERRRAAGTELDRADRRLEARAAARRSATFLRAQVSHDYRAQRARAARTSRTSRSAWRSTSDTFAQVPLLNPDQLVTSWREMLPNHRDAEVRRLPLDLKAARRLSRRSRLRSPARLHHRHRLGRRPGDQGRRRTDADVRRQPLHRRAGRRTATCR